MTAVPAAHSRPSSSGVSGQLDPAGRPYVWIDGELLPKSEAKISVWDHGLLYGDGCFEGIRVYRGRIFKARQHMNRIYRNAERLRMKMPWSPDETIELMRRCIAANGLSEGYIRLLFTRGVGTLGLDPRKCPRPSLICIADQIMLYPPELYSEGMKVVIAKRPRTPTACLDPSLKSLNYLNNILAKCEAIDAGCLEAIMLSIDGYVGECTGDNLFIVKGGEVFTSPLEVGMLDGITRAFVMQTLCPACGVRVTEKRLRPEDVLSADEIFLTGSAAEIIAVTQVDDRRISPGEGPITKKLRSKFREVVTSEHVPED
ncbi:MAG: branched-chain-amino-acid transaminase [Planctomycetota bacterium]|nr:branched-chain-amino-acid transaminase [Planctomycetota bacterium]